VSIVIVSYNTRDLTLLAVQSVLESCRGLEVEIIVVDNGSADGSAEAVRAAFPGVIVLQRPNLGFAFGCNEGMSAARSRYLLLLNPDVEVCGSAIPDCLAHMQAHRKVGILGCRLIHPAGSVHPTIFRFVTLKHLIWNILVSDGIMRRSTWFGDPHYAALERDQIHDVEVVAGCFMLMRREVLQEVGGLDERFFLYSEESEWCFRIRSAGWRVRYFPLAKAYHRGGASTASVPILSAVQIAKSQVIFLLLTRGKIVARAAAIMMLLSTALRLLLPADKRRLSRAALRARFRCLFQACLQLPDEDSPEPRRWRI
jgi:GT2 family glycosyltransferase